MGKLLQATTEVNVRQGPGAVDKYVVLDTLQIGDVVEEVDLNSKDWAAIEMDDNSIGFISRKFLSSEIKPVNTLKQTTVAPVVVPSKPTTETNEPPQITWFKKYLGFKEVPGSGDNPTIVSWVKLIKNLPSSMWHDATPWCAIAVFASFKLSNYKGKIVESAAAVDWLKFGTPTTKPQLGDVVVFQWDDGSHHVAEVMSVSGGMVHVVGGNQSDAVTYASYSTSYVMGYRRP